MKLKLWLGITLISLLVQLAISSCGKLNASGARAEIVMPLISGVTCYIIRDDDGKGVGGNCLKN